ncbi:NAD-dependent epimerase/dehydratase family protein [Fictibacillus sp. NRS-1165]|uniref:NAD-dependent epimerase/dehydratase family protein n=1 Tax=Fictibacillus sp. NRS-1165 TaxID=3144463 RepID=UPI003D21E3B8
MKSVAELEHQLTEHSDKFPEFLSTLDGDLLILGVGGKMGPSLARLAKKAIDKLQMKKRVIGVSRFSSDSLRQELEADGIETIAADLLNEEQLGALPDVKNVIFMAGTKFGTTGNEPFTWAMNAYLPGRIAEKFKQSRIVSFSTGNVYPLTSVSLGGASEEHPPSPIGEYAQSCLGRERIFEYFSRKYNIPMVQFRLNYAIDMRYGVLSDVARAIMEEKTIDLQMGNVNVIWQGDANEMAIRALGLCSTPPFTLNVTGPETVSLRWLATRFSELLGKDPLFINEEQETALLSNSSKAHQLLGYPRVSLRQMMDWTVQWIETGGSNINKPTHFQERVGSF